MHEHVKANLLQHFNNAMRLVALAAVTAAIAILITGCAQNSETASRTDSQNSVPNSTAGDIDNKIVNVEGVTTDGMAMLMTTLLNEQGIRDILSARARVIAGGPLTADAPPEGEEITGDRGTAFPESISPFREDLLSGGGGVAIVAGQFNLQIVNGESGSPWGDWSGTAGGNPNVRGGDATSTTTQDIRAAIELVAQLHTAGFSQGANLATQLASAFDGASASPTGGAQTSENTADLQLLMDALEFEKENPGLLEAVFNVAGNLKKEPEPEPEPSATE